MDHESIAPGATDRAIFVGMTGSGKSYLARALLEARPYVAIWDGKGDVRWAGYRRYESLAALERGTRKPEKVPRFIYAPKASELRDRDARDAFFDWVYERENTLLYVDEIYSVTDNRWSDIPSGLHAILTRGRARNTPLWGAVQRPSRIDHAFMTEAEHAYVFRLQAPQDRARVQEIWGIPPGAIGPGFAKRDFWYARLGEHPIGPLRYTPTPR